MGGPRRGRRRRDRARPSGRPHRARRAPSSPLPSQARWADEAAAAVAALAVAERDEPPPPASEPRPSAPSPGRPDASPRAARRRGPDATLSVLPPDVVAALLQRLPTEDWPSLRATSRALRAAVDAAARREGLRATTEGDASRIRPGTAAYWRALPRCPGAWRVPPRSGAPWAVAFHDPDAALLVAVDDPDLIRLRRVRGHPAATRAALTERGGDAWTPPLGPRVALLSRSAACLRFLVAEARGRGRGGRAPEGPAWIGAALRLACARGWLEGAATLVRDFGADVDATDGRDGPGGADSALLMAASRGHVDVVRWLSGDAAAGGAGADVEAADDGGWRALHHAASEGHADVVEALCAAGASCDARAGGDDDDGPTPLHLAAAGGHPGAARALLDAGGADVNARAGDWGTPLMACSDGAVADLLRDWGGEADSE